jgi:hypothetical protein
MQAKMCKTIALILGGAVSQMFLRCKCDYMQWHFSFSYQKLALIKVLVPSEHELKPLWGWI